MDLDAYRDRAQAYATALNTAHHRRFSGRAADWDPAAIHATHADLLTRETIAALRDAGPSAARLHRFAVASRLRAVAAPADAERARREAAAGLHAITARLAAEDDPRARRALEEQRLAIVAEQLSAPAAAALERVREEVRALGWPSARALWTALMEVDLGALAVRAQEILREPAPSLGDARTRADLPRWHRAAWADRWFPADRLVPTLHDAVRAAGHAPDSLTLDLEPLPGRSPRAFLAALRVPDQLVVVVRPAGGRPDAEALFHEVGHALALGAIPSDAPFEERHLVPAHEAEAAAFAFEDRVPDHGDERLAEHAATARTLRRRRQAARFLHELELLEHGPVEGLRERYARRMAAATGLAWPAAPWVLDADPLLASADYLRGDLMG